MSVLNIKSHEVSPQINSTVQESCSLKVKIHLILYLQLVEPWSVHALHLHVFLLVAELHIYFFLTVIILWLFVFIISAAKYLINFNLKSNCENYEA